jgi:glycosyltransferase involved in cell wall biosynthesis
MNNFNLSENIFGAAASIDETCQIVFVADMFAEDYEGGAELTTEALIGSSPFKVCKVKSRNVTIDTLKQGIDKFWIFGNFAGLNPQLIPSIVGNLKYSILEYDYKYCKYRSPEKHLAVAGSECDCHGQINGKLISAFYYGAEGMWWMSEAQKDHYAKLFPFLLDKSSIVLSSVFSKNTLATLKLLRGQLSSSPDRKNWIVLGSDSWIKGADDAKNWCEKNEKSYEVVWGVKYEELLAKLASSEGFVYLPKGKDTCPRMVIEAKLLGCKLHINENVQHANEEWFATDNVEEIEEYLYSAHEMFWNGIKAFMDYVPSVSGYLTTRNCIEQKYPYEQAIKSLLQFCNEVCIVDGGSTDGTWETLTALANSDQRVKIKQVLRDWNHPRHAVFDGMQKAEARAMCTSEFCWQMDSDEVVHEDDSQKIANLCKKFPNGVDILALPVVEYWGSDKKVRIDIFPWKWRLSRNKPYVTHGIPVDARLTDEAGHLYAAYGDGCDMIHKETGQVIPHLSFYSQEVDNVRKKAVIGDPEALQQYQEWFNKVVESLPGVFHYSWYDIERKIHLYKKYWTQHWESLYGKKYEDTAESNMMFDVPWSDVTDEMIKLRASELSEKLGGWIWHQKWDGNVKTHHVVIQKAQPQMMKDVVR